MSCEDMMIPEGTCEQCEFGGECLIVRKKLYGRNGGDRSKLQFNNHAATPATPIEESINV